MVEDFQITLYTAFYDIREKNKPKKMVQSGLATLWSQELDSKSLEKNQYIYFFIMQHF